MKKTRLRTFTMLIGSVLALAIAFSQFLTSEFISSAHEKVKTEHTEGEPAHEGRTFISLPSFSLPAPVNVESSLNPYCLFEIVFEQDNNETPEDDDVSFVDHFFRTMFQVIISPNAP